MGTIAGSIIAVLCGALFVLFVFATLCVAILNTHDAPAGADADGRRAPLGPGD